VNNWARCPKNDFNFWEEPANQQVLLRSISELKQRIQQAKPNLVLCLGAKPLKYLMGKTNIGDWRGHVVWNQDLSCKTLATYHPSACLRQRFVEEKQNPGQFDRLFIHDIKKAFQEQHTPDLTYYKYQEIIQPSFSQVESWLEAALRDAKLLSFDIETLGCHKGKKDYAALLIDCIGLAYKPDEVICIPLWMPTGKLTACRYWKSEAEFCKILSLLNLLLSSDLPKVAQNSQFDCLVLQEILKIRVRNVIWDTMVAAHNLYCELPKDLGTLISIFTNLEYKKFMVKEGNIQARWKYNAADAIANYHVMSGQVEEMNDFGIFNHYYQVTNPALSACLAMQQAGVRIDLQLQQTAQKITSNFIEELLWALDKALPIRLTKDKHDPLNFNPGSSQQRSRLFYDYFRCKTVFNKGTLTTDKDAVETFTKDFREPVRLIAWGCLKHSKTTNLLEDLLVPLREGRVHCAYRVDGTDTGRLSSSASNLLTYNEEQKTWEKAGTNLQNRQSGIQRQMILPEVGEIFAVVDLWAAEAYLTFLDAEEEKGLQLLEEGKKIHNWLFEATQARFPVDVEKAKYGYNEAKQNIHSLNYGVAPPKMSEESGLPLQVSQWQYNLYHSTFPGIRLRQKRIETELLSLGRLVSFLGRHRTFFSKFSPTLLNIAYAWPSQSCIGEITILAMTKLYNITQSGRFFIFPSLNTHDGLVLRVKRGTEKEAKEIIQDAFDIPITKGNRSIRIPITLQWGENFNDLGEKEILLKKG